MVTLFFTLGLGLATAQTPQGLASSAPEAAQPMPAPAAAPAASQGADNLIEGLPPGPPPPADDVQQIAYEIGVTMRCPVCQGMSVADSNSPAAVNMQNRIRELVAAGYSEDQIKASFVDSYGEWILLEPTRKGLNLLVWIGPLVFVAVGLGLAWTTAMQWRKEEDEVPLPSDVGLASKDPFEERLLAELED